MQDIMKKEGDSPKEKWAVIAFTDGARLPWLKLLKPGFRHCLVSVCDGVHWLTVDPMLHKTEVAVQPVAASFDLAAWYRDLGFVVVETALFSPPLKSKPKTSAPPSRRRRAKCPPTKPLIPVMRQRIAKTYAVFPRLKAWLINLNSQKGSLPTPRKA